MKKIVYFIAIYFISITAFSQTTYLNLRKYWYYKQRLLKQFMVYGPNTQGTNHPSILRGYYPAYFNHISYDDDGNQESWPVVDWGDNNANLQNYIAVLATEYRLLKDYGQDYRITFNELIWAMHALERIDYNTESNYNDRNGNPGTNENNGFMMRDDVHFNFLNQHNDDEHDFSGRYVISCYSTQGKDDPSVPGFIEPPYEMSQDNVWNYLPALALVNKLVDDPLPIHGGMQNWAKERAYLMVKSLQGCQWGFWLFGKWRCINYGWRLRNPVTMENVTDGSKTRELSWGFAKAADKITAGSYPSLNQKTHPFIFSTDLYNPIQFVSKNIYNKSYRSKILQAVIGFDWFMFIAETKKSRQWEYFEHLPLLTMILHEDEFADDDDPYYDFRDVEGNFLRLFLEHKLNIAPECGPIDHGDIYETGYEEYWSSTNRTIWPEQADNNDANIWNGEYSGLDYMLLHNLYWLTFYDNNRENVMIYSEAPYGGMYIGGVTNYIYEDAGTKDKPITIRARNTLSANNRIKADADVRFESENEIVLLPGFEIELGADFDARIVEKPVYRKIYYTPSCPDYPITYSYEPVTNIDSTETQNDKGTNPVQDEIIENNCMFSYNISPNPGMGIYTLLLEEPDINNTYIEIVNLNGIIIYSKKINSNILNIYIENQPAGIYICKIISSNRVYTSKIIKR